MLSPSTEQDDRGDKWHSYQHLASLQQYLLVGQAEPRVELYTRHASGDWTYRDVTSGRVTLASGAEIDLDALYDDLPP